MVRAVFDTVVFVSALINPHGRCGRLLFELFDRYELVLSPAIIREILEVLLRPSVVSRATKLREIRLEDILDLLRLSEVVEPQAKLAVSRDPKDDVFVETAMEGRADFLVSEDKDLLELDGYRGLRVVRCREFLELIEAQE